MASDKHADRANDRTIPDRVRTEICELLGLDEPEVTHDATLVGDLGADSLDLVELAMALEEEYGISLEDASEVWAHATVGQLVVDLTKAGAKL